MIKVRFPSVRSSVCLFVLSFLCLSFRSFRSVLYPFRPASPATSRYEGGDGKMNPSLTSLVHYLQTATQATQTTCSGHWLKQYRLYSIWQPAAGNLGPSHPSHPSHPGHLARARGSLSIKKRQLLLTWAEVMKEQTWQIRIPCDSQDFQPKFFCLLFKL